MKTASQGFVGQVAKFLEGWGHLPTGGGRSQEAIIGANPGYIADAEELGMDPHQCAKNISLRTRY